MLRITDVLLRNLINAMIQNDQMMTLVEKIRSCGITFQVLIHTTNCKLVIPFFLNRSGKLKMVREDDQKMFTSGRH